MFGCNINLFTPITSQQKIFAVERKLENFRLRYGECDKLGRARDVAARGIDHDELMALWGGVIK